jgi:hypothetical protein
MERASSALSILLMNINAVFLTATYIITCFFPFSRGKYGGERGKYGGGKF